MRPPDTTRRRFPTSYDTLFRVSRLRSAIGFGEPNFWSAKRLLGLGEEITVRFSLWSCYPMKPGLPENDPRPLPPIPSKNTWPGASNRENWLTREHSADILCGSKEETARIAPKGRPNLGQASFRQPADTSRSRGRGDHSRRWAGLRGFCRRTLRRCLRTIAERIGDRSHLFRTLAFPRRFRRGTGGLPTIGLGRDSWARRTCCTSVDHPKSCRRRLP